MRRLRAGMVLSLVRPCVSHAARRLLRLAAEGAVYTDASGLEPFSRSATAIGTPDASTPNAQARALEATDFSTLFELDLGQGFCVGVALPTLEELMPLELEYPLASAGVTAVDFWGGRLAMRRAIGRSPAFQDSAIVPPIMRRDDGSPMLPDHVLGSISHKRPIAVALVGRADAGVRALGVDLENADVSPDAEGRRTAFRLAQRILSAGERASLGPLAASVPEELVPRLCFSLKEAVYKAISREAQRRVGFLEVSIRPRGDGTCDVVIPNDVLRLAATARPPTVLATWRRFDVPPDDTTGRPSKTYFLSTAQLLL